MTSRIHRGFHRIGVVLAALPLCGAGWLGGKGAWEQAGSQDPWDNYFGVPSAFAADYRRSLLLLALALALYAATRAVGWVLDGFMGSRDQM